MDEYFLSLREKKIDRVEDFKMEDELELWNQRLTEKIVRKYKKAFLALAKN